jgi:tryptophan synthase alpha chain
VIFSYLNPILRYGLHKFADDAAAAGVDGVLVTDLIVEEAGEYLAEMAAWDLRRFFWPRPPVPTSGLRPSPRTPRVLFTPSRAWALPARSRA